MIIRNWSGDAVFLFCLKKCRRNCKQRFLMLIAVSSDRVMYVSVDVINRMPRLADFCFR